MSPLRPRSRLCCLLALCCWCPCIPVPVHIRSGGLRYGRIHHACQHYPRIRKVRKAVDHRMYGLAYGIWTKCAYMLRLIWFGCILRVGQTNIVERKVIPDLPARSDFVVSTYPSAWAYPEDANGRVNPPPQYLYCGDVPIAQTPSCASPCPKIARGVVGRMCYIVESANPCTADGKPQSRWNLFRS